MDAAQAIAELSELSSQIDVAVLIGPDGTLLAATTEDARAEALARAAVELVAAAGALHDSGPGVARVDVELSEGAVFVVVEGDRAIAATTRPEPTTGLVVYDLRTCLRRVDEKPKRRRRLKKPVELE